MADDPYNELGRRLLAAVQSHRLGLSSVDYVLRKYTPREVDFSWAALARELDRAVAEHLGRVLTPKATDITSKIQ